MKLQSRNLLILAALAVMTNGLTLFGLNHVSAGALARNIECNSTMSRNIQVAESLKQLTGLPPCRPDKAWAGPFSFSR